MTNNQAINTIAHKMVVLHRGNLNALARLQALETMIGMRVPEAEREAWWDKLDALNTKLLQDLLENREKDSPAFAAFLRNQKQEGLSGLEK